MASVSLENVAKTYPGNVAAVRDVNLEIADGEFVVLVGPSGCGKSSTLRMIAGLEEISAGTIRIGGRVVNHLPPKSRDIAMVFQNYALYPHMTVFDNMAFALQLRGQSRTEIRATVETTAATLGLTDLLKRRPRQLSGGQRQRVALGRAIVRQPAVFLFDEPLSNLDAKMRAQMRVEIKRMHQSLKQTMIYVTHDQTEAMTLGDRIVVMCDGVVQQVAVPRDLYSKPANTFVALFVGTPAMNLVDGEVDGENGDLIFRSADLRLTLPHEWRRLADRIIGRRIILGARPEDVTLAGAKVPDLHAIVDVVEPTGADVYLYLKAGGSSLSVRVDPKVHVRVGQPLGLCIDAAHIHLFDAASKEANR